MVDLFFGRGHEGVLDAEHDVGARAAAGGLLQEVAALQRGCQTRHGAVASTPRFAVVLHLPVALTARPVPDHFLRPKGEQQQRDQKEKQRQLLCLISAQEGPSFKQTPTMHCP